MNKNDQHSDESLPLFLKELKESALLNSEFLTPEGYFEEMEKEIFIKVAVSDSLQTEFETPTNYFNDAIEKINAAILNEYGEEQFFLDQQQQILSQVRLSAIESNEQTFEVPKDFFEKQESEIFKQLSKTKSVGRRIHLNIRYVGYAAAAASVVVALFVLWPIKKPNELSFAAKLETTELDIDDLEYFADEETYYDLFLHATETDTLSTDTIGMGDPKKDLQLQETKDLEKLDPKTGFPVTNGIKPSDAEKTLTWDDVSEEDLMKYLLEEGDDELMDDLN